MEVEAKNGETFTVEIRPLSELALVEAAEKYGLELVDLEKQTGKAVAKMHFLDDVVANALVETPELRLDVDTLSKVLRPQARAAIFRKVLELSGYSVKQKAELDKFPGQPTK